MISGTSKYTFDQRKMLLMMQDAIDRGVELTMKEWVKQMSGRSGVLRRKGTGKEYRGGLKGKGSLRRRSVPGQPPAVDTEQLALSVTDREPSRVKTLTVIKRGIIGIKHYGFILDQAKGKRARPWIEPSKALLRAKVGDKYDRYILGELNRAMAAVLKQIKGSTK
jgi:hypothetical protein